MNIPFTKAHGAMNDFLLTWTREAPAEDLPAIARAICHRNTGVGADGWMLVAADGGPDQEYDGTIRLFNMDGSEPELSGNGTRCAAALLVDAGHQGNEIRLRTGAGIKRLRLLERRGHECLFEMNMGKPEWKPDEVRAALPLTAGEQEATLVYVGNPQCAVFVAEFPADWRNTAAELERHQRFPNRTNVSFVRPVSPHTIEVQFYERGVGETMSSGTGSTGAAVAAILRGAATSPVEVRTPAGPLQIRWESDDVFLTGPAVLTARGEFFYS